MLKTTFDLFLEMCELPREDFERLPDDEKEALIREFNELCEMWRA